MQLLNRGKQLKNKERFVQGFFVFVTFLCLSTLAAVPKNSYAMMEDHTLALNLVSDEAATHSSVKSDDWEDPATWGGSDPDDIPDDGARVIIAEGHEVEINSKLTPALRTLRVDGTLSFDPAEDTEITFDTFLVNMLGTLEIGSESQPIQDGKTAHLIVTT